MATSTVRPFERRRSSIKKEFSEKELQDLRTAFVLMDSDQDGRVSASEFKIMLGKLGINLEDETIEELIRSASHVARSADSPLSKDAGTELIDENEFLQWVKRIQELRPSEDSSSELELLAAFRVFDVNNDGYITKDELKSAMDMIEESVTECQLQEFLTMADIDKDGRINYEEFAKLLS